MNTEHIVNFYKWCPSCEHSTDSETVDSSPCYDCMYDATNIDTDKPTYWKEQKEKKK